MDTSGLGWFHPSVRSLTSQLRVLLNLVLAGTLLRLIGLGTHALWLDEGACWSWATRESWWGQDGTIFAEANHPPGWWVVTRLWIETFGSDSEAALRAPAAVFGILTIPLAWMLARRLLDPGQRPSRGGFDHTPDDGRGARQALWLAGFVALSTYFAEYSQEARMYAALIAEGLGLSLLYLRWLDKRDKLSLVGYALLAAAALYTQYFALWIIMGHAGHALWLWHRGRKDGVAFDLRPFALACIAAGLLFVPWFIFMVRNYEGISTGQPFEPFSRLAYVLWRVGVGPGLVVVDRGRLTEGVGAVIGEEALIGAITVVLWFTPLILGFIRLRRHPGVASFVLCNLALPIGVLLLIFPKFALIHERYVVFLAPWLFLVAVIGAFEAKRVLRPFLIGGLVLLTGAGLFAYHGVSAHLVAELPAQALGDVDVPSAYVPDPNDPATVLHHGHPFGKEPWRQARTFIRAHAEPGDLVVMHPPYLHLVWDYYETRMLAQATPGEDALESEHAVGPALETVALPRETIDAAEIEKRLGGSLADRTRVFLILAHEETDDPDHYFRALHRALITIWVADGGGRIDPPVKPILFDTSWGVRVAIFNRR